MKTPRKIWPRVSAVGEVEPALKWKSLQVIRAMICLLLFWALVVPVSAGDITGKVELSVKKPLKRSSNDTPKAVKNQKELYGRRGLNFRVPGSDEDGGLTKKELREVQEADYVLVYVSKSRDGEKLPATRTPVELLQKKRVFEAHVTPVVVGSWVTFRSEDKFEHDIYSSRKSSFRIGVHTKANPQKQKAAGIGPHEIFCNIHTLMNAYIFVVPNNFYAMAKDGEYRIKDVPPGTYELKAWHPRLGWKAKVVEVGEESVSADFTL